MTFFDLLGLILAVAFVALLLNELSKQPPLKVDIEMRRPRPIDSEMIEDDDDSGLVALHRRTTAFDGKQYGWPY